MLDLGNLGNKGTRNKVQDLGIKFMRDILEQHKGMEKGRGGNDGGIGQPVVNKSIIS